MSQSTLYIAIIAALAVLILILLIFTRAKGRKKTTDAVDEKWTVRERMDGVWYLIEVVAEGEEDELIGSVSRNESDKDAHLKALRDKARERAAKLNGFKPSK